MSSSDAEIENLQQHNYQMFQENLHLKRKKDYICPCGRPYGSYPALYAHIKRKHDGKAPGQITKPKSIRRRGRPFKYEPIKLQSQNPHRTASKHLEQYLTKVQKQKEINEYPLKEFADRNLKFPFPNFKTTENQISKQNYGFENGENGDQRSGNRMDVPVYRFGSREERNILPQDRFLREEGEQYLMNSQQRIRNQQRIRILPVEQSGTDFRFRAHDNMSMDRENLLDYKRLINEKTGLQNSDFIANDQYYNRFQFLQEQNARNQFARSFDSSFENLYSKPFEIALREEMEAKFKPISQGIIHFLEPILQQLLSQCSFSQVEKPIPVDRSPSQNPEGQEILPAENLAELNEKSPQKNNKTQQKRQKNQVQNNSDSITVSSLLENDHFRDILKWLMSPPEQILSERMKENYIEFSFRCCLVEFLDFLHNFLETVQHEQVLLILVFYCDHILAETGSFQLQPEPQIYEMGLYFNSFMNEYLPKLLKFMPCLENFYIFKELKKKVSELFMWMSSWQAIQQYYHNKYNRERISYEISQESYKCMMYQRKYQSYMREAMRGGIGETQQMHVRPQVEQIDENQEVQQKTQENPELIILNTQQHLYANDEVDNQQQRQDISRTISKVQHPEFDDQNQIDSQQINDQNQIDSHITVHEQIQIIDNSNIDGNREQDLKQEEENGEKDNSVEQVRSKSICEQ